MNHFPKTVATLPTKPYFAILTPRSVFIPGDERSRTNPGHGYPEHTEQSWDIEVYEKQSDWETKVKELALRKDRNFQAVKVDPVKVELGVIISQVVQLRP